MITDINYSITFPTNGVSLQGRHSLQPGTTAITGRNGRGKSFGSIEMIRYGLFGTKALRGPAPDYKQLDMAMTFEIAGASYAVARNRKKEELKDAAGETLAVGADAVNKRVLEILGFGLEVFDVVCAVNQKESERLSKLTPAKRKALIDEVVGLTQQEAVEKACKDEALGLRREADVLSRSLVVPIEPVVPESYQSSETWSAILDETRALVAKRDALEKVIAAVGSEPTRPADTMVDVTELDAHEARRLEQAAHLGSLERQIAAIPMADVTAEQIEQADALAAYDAEVSRRGPRPSLDDPLLLLREMLDTWSEIDALKRAGRLEVHCPKCAHTFQPAQELPEEPPYSRAVIDAELTARGAWALALPEPAGERMVVTQAMRLAVARGAERTALIFERDAIVPLTDRRAELVTAREINTRWAIFESELAVHAGRSELAREAREALVATPEPTLSVEDANDAYVKARIYESEHAAYRAAKTRFDELTADVADKASRAEGFTAGAKGLAEARRTLKAYLAPSLSRVASTLLQQMTENADRPLLHAEIDEDMNIIIDGQDISTLSGAQATIANLAIRIALGQVLVAKVFPVFIGDEIDSDMDDLNAQATADALTALNGQIRQIILVSHKRLENVDQEINLDVPRP